MMSAERPTCIRVERDEQGAYTIIGEIEDWGEVQAGDFSGDNEVKCMGSLGGWGWERVYRINIPVGGGWDEQWYFVSQEGA
jgi:hypothetical protein